MQKQQLLKLALIDGIHPASYYQLELFKTQRYATRFCSLFEEESSAFQRAVNKSVNESIDKRRLIKNKELFVDFCEKWNLPVAPILRTYPGRIQKPGALPPVDLFLKLRDGTRGQGADWFVFDPETCEYHSKTTKAVFPASNIEQYFESLSKKQPYILQKCLRNHPNLEQMIGRTLGTLRVHTVYNAESCRGSVVSIALKAPVSGAVTDSDTNTLYFAVNRQTGVIGEGVQRFTPLVNRTPIAPATGQVIKGERIPDHQKVVEICEKAHAGFPEFCILGWDVALTAKGPLFLETNINWSIEPCELVNETRLFSTVAAAQVMRLLKIK